MTVLSFLKRGPGFYKRVAGLAFPIVMQNLITNTLGLVDTFMVGMLGEQAMSAVTLANVPVFVVTLVIFGLQSGSSVLMSQYWGRGDRDAINRVIGIGCYVAGGLSLIFAGVMFLIPVPVSYTHLALHPVRRSGRHPWWPDAGSRRSRRER